MRHTPTAIRQFLTDQLVSGQTIADFCAEHGLKVPTFYSWKKRYREIDAIESVGFCKLIPARETAQRSLRLPNGVRLELTGLTTTEIAEVILEIDRAYV